MTVWKHPQKQSFTSEQPCFQKNILHLNMKQLSFLKKSLTINNEVSKEKGLKTLVIHFHGVFNYSY
ncbi:hypothetical protein BaGK_02955 [Bacillus atrophaeus]|nr:hypothetical protein BaGK_02955 [Bacillus atrophaeus]